MIGSRRRRKFLRLFRLSPRLICRLELECQQPAVIDMFALARFLNRSRKSAVKKPKRPHVPHRKNSLVFLTDSTCGGHWKNYAQSDSHLISVTDRRQLVG